MNFVLIIALFFAIPVAWRFILRFRAERRRQEMITWPEAKAHFDTDNIRLADRLDDRGSYAYVHGGYHFFCRGVTYTGNWVFAINKKLDAKQKSTVENYLNERRQNITVRFNPEAPDDCVLLLPHRELSWSKLLLYTIFGVVIPAALVYAMLVWQQGTALNWLDVITFQ